MKTDYMSYEPLVQYSEVFSSKISNEEFAGRLSKLNLRVAIAVISRFFSLHYSVTSTNDDTETQKAKYLDAALRMSHCYQSVMKNNGNVELYNKRKFIYCPQTLFTLCKWIFKYCDNIGNLRPLQLEDFIEIMDLAMITNDLLPEEIEGNEFEYIFMTLFNGSHPNLKTKIARANYIFSDLMMQIPSTQEFVEDFKNKKGYEFQDYFAVLFNMLILNIPSFDLQSFCTKHLAFNTQEFDAKKLTSIYPLVIEDFVINKDEIKTQATRSLTNDWDFEMFYLRPLIKIEDSLQSLSEVTLSNYFWEGLYWKVRFMYEKEDMRFLREFGRPFEKYIQWLTKESISEDGIYRFQNEFAYDTVGGEALSTDCYVRIANTLIAVEAKAKAPHSQTLKKYNLEQIKHEYIDLLVDPVRQVDARIKEIISLGDKLTEDVSAFFSGIDEIIVLCVSMEKVQPVGGMFEYADKLIHDEVNQITGKIKAYHNINIEDYEAICALFSTDIDLQSVFLDWFQVCRADKYSAIPLSNYLSAKGYKYECPQKLDSIFSQTMEIFYKRVFGDGGDQTCPN